LTTRCVKRNKNYDPVRKYEDFPEREHLVLDVYEKTKLIDGHDKEILTHPFQINRYGVFDRIAEYQAGEPSGDGWNLPAVEERLQFSISIDFDFLLDSFVGDVACVVEREGV